MPIWLTRSIDSGLCEACQGKYGPGDPVGVIQINDTLTLYAHPTCWLDLCLDAIGASPGSKVKLDPSIHAQRRRLLHHWSQLAYTERKARTQSDISKRDRTLSYIHAKRLDLARQIEDYGGVPVSWEMLLKQAS